jgi:hypothetical protein
MFAFALNAPQEMKIAAKNADEGKKAAIQFRLLALFSN